MFERFFSKPFGLHITDSHISAAELRLDGQHFAVSAIHRKELPAGVIRNGRIVNQKTLATIIDEFLKEAKPHPILSKQCIVALPESQSYEYVFHFPPDLTGDALQNAVAQKIAETIPVPIAEIKYDYAVYRFGSGTVAFAVAVQRTVIGEYYDVLRNQCGLRPVLFEPESLSILRNISFPPNLQNLILMYASSRHVTWFSLWNGVLFDSNRLSVEQGRHATMAKDLQRSCDFFKEKTGQTVEKILLTGNENTLKVVQTFLQPILIPFETVSSYKAIPPQGIADPAELHISIGLALRSFDLHPKMPIDLLKK